MVIAFFLVNILVKDVFGIRHLIKERGNQKRNEFWNTFLAFRNDWGSLHWDFIWISLYNILYMLYIDTSFHFSKDSPHFWSLIMNNSVSFLKKKNSFQNQQTGQRSFNNIRKLNINSAPGHE